MNRCYRWLALGALWLALGAWPTQAQELPLGSTLPLQSLAVQHVGGTQTTIGALTGRVGTAFIFWSNQCAWTEKYEQRVLDLYAAYANAGIAFVLVNSNDPNEFPQEAASVGQGKNYPIPYVTDPGAQFAEGLGASRNPEVFAFDSDKTLVYTGSIDDSPGDPGNVKKTYFKDVLESLKKGGGVDVPSTKAFGCRIRSQRAGG